MRSSLRTKVALWFFFVVVAVGVAGYAGFRRLSDYILEEARAQMNSKLEHVMGALAATNSTYLDLVRSSMAVLKMLCLQDGEPRLDRTINPDGSSEQTLYFGNHPVAEDHPPVDRVKAMTGGTATIFVKRDDAFIRVATNIFEPDGSRAVGTELDSNSPAMAAIRRGDAFYGAVDVLGKPYITGYEPIRNPQGETIGVFYVGFPLESLSEISEAVKDRGILRSGFFALVNHEDQIVFRTEGVGDLRELEAIVAKTEQNKPVDSRWFVQMKTFVPWDYDVIAALYLPDVSAETFEIIWQVYGIGSLIIVGVLVVSFWLGSRLSVALGQAEASRKEALEARDAAESANRTKSTFLANMSHELRTPMNAILGYSEMLIEEAEGLNVKDLTTDLTKIRSAGKQLLSLINDVLDLSKIEAGKMTLFVEQINIASMIHDVSTTIQPLVDKNSNALEINIAPDCGSINADLTKIRQTLLNLLSNASKFTKNGRITLTVRRLRGTSVLSSQTETDLKATHERIQFSVEDTGIGMTPEQQGKLFKAFSQTDASTTRKYGGTGLGLAISRRFCQLMGGDISVTSELGKGSTFTVDIPVEVAEATDRQAPPTSESPSRKFVLVIDDDQDASQLLMRSLSKAGYRVITANDGKAGLEIARKQNPAAITLDVMMPGMDGWSVLTALKSDPATASIPVIMMTMLQDRHLGFTLGASEFLTKPVDQDRLRQAVSAYCGHPTAYALVVEDDISSRQLLCRTLESEGIRVHEAENGNAALERIAVETPAVILLDLMMPVMDGFEFVRALRQDRRFASIPIIVLTAKDLNAEERARLADGVQDVIAKSAVDRQELLSEITNILARTVPAE
jgi:signal transduction histidine kinase/CheY-like chemotaxis protein